MSASHSSSDDHGTHSSAEVHPHPPMPAVHDEAADTPAWVPVSGVVLFLVLVLFVMMRASMAPAVPAGADTTDQAYPGEAPTPAPAAAAQ